MDRAVEPRRIHWLYLVMACGGALLLTNKAPFLAIGVTLVTLYIGLTAWATKGKILAIYGKPLTILVCLYFYLVWSYIASNQPISGMISYDFLKNDGNFFFAYAMFFAFATPYLNYKWLFSAYHLTLLMVFSMLAALAVLETIAGGRPGIVTRRDVGELLFTAFNKAHNATGSAYAAACVVALSALLFDSTSAKKRRNYTIFLVLCLLGLLMTKSRGSLLAFGVAATFLYYRKYGSIKATASRVAVFAVILVLVAFATGAQHRILSAVNYAGDANIMDRFGAWVKAWQLFLLSPTIGVGFGRYNDVYYYSRITKGLVDGIPGLAALCTGAPAFYNDGHAHNSYLQFLAETGILGLGLLLAFWGSLYSRLKKAASLAKSDPTIKFAGMMGQANIVLLLFLSLTENYLSATTIMLFMSASIGISLGIIGQAKFRAESDDVN